MARPRKYQEEQVLDAVMDVFWSRGYQLTSAQDLVDATGLTRSSLYNAYVNKQGLFEQALARYKHCTAQFVEQLEQASDKKAAIRSLLLSIVDTNGNDPARRGCLVTNTAIEPIGREERIAALVRQNLRLLETALQRAVLQGQEAGDIRSDKPADALAACVLNTIQGLRVLAKATQEEDRARLTGIIDTTLDTLL